MNRTLASLAALTALAAANVHATPIRLDGAEDNLQEIMNDMTVGGASSVNAVTEQYGPDQGWAVNSVFGGQGMIVLELAGFEYQNRFGIYDITDTTKRLQLFGGADGSGASTSFEIRDSGVFRNNVNTGVTFASELFGFYLETPVGLWYSQSLLNGDRGDHMVAYQGQGDQIYTPQATIATWGPDLFLLGWEDLSLSGWDQDYNDFIVFVGGVKGVEVPEPTSLALLGLGLMGAAMFRRRRVAIAA